MTQAIQSSRQTIVIPGTEYSVTVDKTYLYAVRSILGLCVIGGCGVAMSSISQYRLPTWGYVIDAVLTVTSALCLLGTYFSKKEPPEQEALMAPKLSLHTAPSINDVSEDHMKLVEKLCEGKGKCDLEQARSIVKDLKQQNHLALLNVIPPFCSNTLGPHFYTHETQRTPLQCYASEGDLEISKLLVEHGALDYCGDKNNTSALYEAAFYGHLHMVEYLIEQGAHANLAFKKNPLFYFIPKFAFEMVMCKSHLEYKSCFVCFRYILDCHSKNHPENLKTQFKIPIDEQEVNILCWLKKMQLIRTQHQGPMIQELQEILIHFGASEQDALTKNDLMVQGMDIGVGITLYEIASQK